jgi:transcription initiation factor IIE alpha subunit
MEISKNNSKEFTERFFDCKNCHIYLTKYIPKTDKNIKCYKCGSTLKELTKKEFQEYERKVFEFIKDGKKEQKRNDKKNKNINKDKKDQLNLKIKTNEKNYLNNINNNKNFL